MLQLRSPCDPFLSLLRLRSGYSPETSDDFLSFVPSFLILLLFILFLPTSPHHLTSLFYTVEFLPKTPTLFVLNFNSKRHLVCPLHAPRPGIFPFASQSNDWSPHSFHLWSPMFPYTRHPRVLQLASSSPTSAPRRCSVIIIWFSPLFSL